MLHARRAVGLVLVLVLSTGAVVADAQTAPVLGDSVTTVAGPRYAAGPLRARLLGKNYRDLWTAAVRVPVLDPGAFAGGLVPVRAGGGLTTEALGMRGADGREYVFRSVDKDVTPALPEDLRGTIAHQVVQDAISAQHPAAALVVAPLLRAAGVLHATPRLFVMPDHPFLGEFRESFGGRLGWMEERPEEAESGSYSFAGSDEVDGTEDFLDDLEDDPRNRADSRAYLAARLMDLLVGDWDRHADQWRWARFDQPDGVRLWRPIPRDRDNALASHEGVLYAFARGTDPRRVRFGPEYRDLLGLLIDASGLDRRLLADLPRPVWDSLAVALRARVTDGVIQDAVAELPVEYRVRGGAELVQSLQGRRDRLPEAAARFYKLLAREVDVRASDADERVSIQRHADGSVEVEIRTLRSRSGVVDGRRGYSRRFDPLETREIRVFLHGGDDSVVIRGRARRSLRVRVIGGGGDDSLVDSSSVARGPPATVLYDHRGDNRFHEGAEAKADRRDPPEFPSSDSVLHPNAPPPRDWGTAFAPLAPYATGQANVGLVLGFGPLWTVYGFRRQPHARLTALRLLWAPLERHGYGAELEHDRRWTNSLGRTRVRVRATSFEVLRFHGFGNATPDAAPPGRFVVPQTQAVGEMLFSLPLVPSGRVLLISGPAAKWTRPRAGEGTLAAELRPRGTEPFAQLGAIAGIRVDTRDSATFPRRGIRFSTESSGYAWTGGGRFGAVRTDLAGYGSLGGPIGPVVALRAGATRALGGYPFQEAATLGGLASVRGFASGRFTGESSVFAGAELRAARLARAKLLVRGDVGAFLLADAGRVLAGGESAGGWHSALGGGLLFTTLGQVVGVTYARGDAHRLYLHAGVPF